MVEYSVRKGEITGHQHFVFFTQCFQKAMTKGSLMNLCHTITEASQIIPYNLLLLALFFKDNDDEDGDNDDDE